MAQALRKLFILALALGCLPMLASAQSLSVGDLTFDSFSSGTDQLDIYNAVGNGLATNTSGGSVTATSFSIDITSLVVDLAGGGTVDLSASDFTVDSEGDLSCDASACNLYGDDITGATLTGTFVYSGLSGLDSGYTGIDSAFTTSITPGCGTTYLDANCDAATITATETSAVVGTPEPSTWALLGVGMLALLLVARKRLRNTNASSAVAV
jgi:hypothetical protein